MIIPQLLSSTQHPINSGSEDFILETLGLLRVDEKQMSPAHELIFIYLFIKLRPTITHKEKEKKKQTAKQNKMARGAATA